MKVDMGFVIIDGKAIGELASVKGLNGRVLCIHCQNVVGRMRPDEVAAGGYCVHYSCTDPKQFVKHTPETFKRMADHVSGSKSVVGRNVFDALQTNTGLHYDAGGWPFDSHV